jgi:PIN domain nuclease of toxin-antitoxin system
MILPSVLMSGRISLLRTTPSLCCHALLDTNAWLRWFHRPQELSSAVRQLLNTQQVVGISPMSIVEVAQKHAKGKLQTPTA